MRDSKHISKSSGFKVPKSYFEDFEVKDFTAEKRNLKSGFSVPEDYFENFEVRVPHQTKVIRLSDVQKTVAVAAVLLVILGTLLTGLLIDSQPNTQQLNFSKINKTQIEDYLEDEMLMDHDLYVDDEDLNLKSIKIEKNFIIDDMDDISIEQLMDY